MDSECISLPTSAADEPIPVNLLYRAGYVKSNGNEDDNEKNDKFTDVSGHARALGQAEEQRRQLSSRHLYQPKPTRRLSLEYLFPVVALVLIMVRGFVLVAEQCAKHKSALVPYVDKPGAFFAFFGSIGNDVTNDLQVGSFIFHFKKFVCIYSFMGVAMRCVWSLSGHNGNSTRVTRCFPRLASFFRRHQWPPFAVLVVLGACFACFAHGPHVFFLFVLSSLNYVIFKGLESCKRVHFWMFIAIMWVVHVAVMYLNEAYSGYERVYWLQRLIPSSVSTHLAVVGTYARPLWRTRMRWFLAYRMYVLRMISFNCDMWEANRGAKATRERALHKHKATCVDCAKLQEQRGEDRSKTLEEGELVGKPEQAAEVRMLVHPSLCVSAPPSAPSSASLSTAVQLDESVWCYKLRTEYSRPTAQYNYLNYTAFLLYTPLYLAGPISSFNAFVSHVQTPARGMSARAMLLYALRIGFVYFLIQMLLHFIYVKSISQDVVVLWNFTLGAQAFFMYYYLAYLWLKFTLIWRLSRLFSLWCGVDVPENMRRCFTNTFSVRDFWRDWHASFNLWIVRYMYIPMGGRRYLLFSIFPIFFFIAIWHDHELHLLKWALCIVVMFALEFIVSSVFSRVERAFSREMENVWENQERRTSLASNGNGGSAVKEKNDGTRRTEEEDDGKCRADTRRGNECVCLRAFGVLARFAALRLTPRQRYGFHRAILVFGGAFSVFALIVANLIGYNEQDDNRTKGSQTDKTIAKGLAAAPSTVCFWLFFSMLMASSQAVMSREMEEQKLQEERARYGLVAVATPLPSAASTAQGEVGIV